jgi:hypothetical protein
MCKAGQSGWQAHLSHCHMQVGFLCVLRHSCVSVCPTMSFMDGRGVLFPSNRTRNRYDGHVVLTLSGEAA